MKNLSKLMLLFLVSEVLVALPVAAEKSSRSGTATQSRGSGTAAQSRRSGPAAQSRGSGSYQSPVIQRQTQLAQPTRQIAPTQIARPAVRQPMVAAPPRQTVTRVPQLSRNDMSPRVSATQNRVAPRGTTQLPQVRPGNSASKQLVLPDRTGIAKQTVTAKAPVVSGNRPTISSSAKNVLTTSNRYQVSGPRVKDSHPAVVRPGQNTIAVRRPDVDRAGSQSWWNANSNPRNLGVSRNFRNDVNWSTRSQDWGSCPWWTRSCVRPWYGGCWNGNWCSSYYRNYYFYDPWYPSYLLPGYAYSDGYYPVGWGLLGWSLGSMVYDIGYETYSNPYPASIIVDSRGADVTYTEPLSRIAPSSADDSGIRESTRSSESIVADSQVAFKARNYLVALELADKAVAVSPADGALHEYRALVLFALGRYGEAAGVLHPVIASGPGWDWSTMRALYDSHDTYTGQLRRLENYTLDHPNAAEARFLLGYHYMVCGHLDSATTQFDSAGNLMPADDVSKQLAKLAKFSVEDTDPSLPPGVQSAPAVAKPLPQEIVPLEKLQGTWVSSRDSGATITLQFAPDGKFSWTYLKDAKTTRLAGAYSINDNGLLVLDSEDSQMVANVSLPADHQMKFVLVGGPPADPGLDFNKP